MDVEPGDKRSLVLTHLAIILTDRNKLGVINQVFYTLSWGVVGGWGGVELTLATQTQHIIARVART